MSFTRTFTSTPRRQLMMLEAAWVVRRARAEPSTLRRFGGKHSARSVSGEIYATSEEGAPVVKLFTKEGCTLCDKAKDVLRR